MNLYRLPIIGIMTLLLCGHLLSAPRACLAATSQDFVLQEIAVTAIAVDNNRIIPSDILRELTSPYLNRRISYVDLEVLRNRLTQWLIDNGYINSGVIIPDQDVQGGVVHLAVVEGKLSSVKVEGNLHFSKNYFIDRITRKTEPPFRISDLQEAFQLLYQDQRISAVNAELGSGLSPGEGNLTIKVSETSPWQLTLSATNDNSPSIGSYHGSLLAANRNLTGSGDTLEGSFGGSEGGYDYGLRYSRPLTSADTMLDLYFRVGEANVIDPLFKPLDIRSSSATYGVRISHPLVKTIRREVRPSLIGEYRESKNYLLGEGFSFSPREKNGVSRYSVARPGLEWVERRDGAVYVASMLLSAGVTDETFISWQGRLLWMQRTGILFSRIHLRGEAQFADSAGLPPMEKYALGGMNSVRGYRKNVLVKDNGINGSLEWWFPLIRDNVTGSESLSVVPFFDYGRGWDYGNGADANKGTDLASVGVGFRGIWKGVTVDFFYGYGFLRSGIATPKDPQEHGVHFAVSWNVL